MVYPYYKWPIKLSPPILKWFTVILYTLIKNVKKYSNKLSKKNWQVVKKYKSNGIIINKIKMLKTFNSLGLDNLALGYLSQFFLIDSKNFKKTI